MYMCVSAFFCVLSVCLGLLQLALSADFNTPTLTSNQGAPVDDVEHSMTAGASGRLRAGGGEQGRLLSSHSYRP